MCIRDSDWRAPISSMFYDHELGAASYSSPTGEVEGDISLKRQYRIRKGQMEYKMCIRDRFTSVPSLPYSKAIR